MSSSLVNRYISNVRTKCMSPIKVLGSTVPCGQCMSCRQKLCNDWVFRIQQEFKHHKFAGFVTLTIKDIYLKLDHYDEINEGWYASIEPKLFNKFINSLQHHLEKKHGSKLSYLMCSEYGEQEGASHRPHFHFMYFTDIVSVHERMMTLCKRFWREKLGKDSRNKCIYDLRGRIDIVKSNGDHQNSDNKIVYKETQGFFGLMPYLVKDMMKDTNPTDTDGKNWVEGEYVGDWCDRLHMKKPYHRASRGFGECYLTSQVRRFHMSDPENNMFVMIDTPDGSFKHRLSEFYKSKLYGRSRKSNLWRKAKFFEARQKSEDRFNEQMQKEIEEIQRDVLRRTGADGYADYYEFNDSVLRIYNERHSRQRLTDVAIRTSKAKSSAQSRRKSRQCDTDTGQIQGRVP